MNRRLNKTVLLIVIGFLVSVVSLQARQGNRQDSMDRYYNTTTVETISGTITAITTVNTWGVHIKVKTANGTTGVHLGPDWYLKGKITLANGDSVTATGSKVQIDGETVIIAKTISKGNVTVQLRNDNGVPLWAGSGKGKNR